MGVQRVWQMDRLRTDTVRHRDQDLRVHVIKNEGRFYFPIDYGIELGETFQWDGSHWKVAGLFRGPNATTVEADRQRPKRPLYP